MGQAIRMERREDGVVVVWMDLEGKPVNTCSGVMLGELEGALGEIEKQRPVGVVFASGKARSFNAGADLVDLQKMDVGHRAAYLARGQKVIDRMAKLSEEGIPTAAAIGGDALGGGFELALACRWRVMAEEKGVTVGLPETKLGLLPAWGGTTRLPRLIGVKEALGILVGGKTMGGSKALAAGLVDEVVGREKLMEAAVGMVTGGRVRTERDWKLGAAEAVEKARRENLERTYGNYPAQTKVMEVVEVGIAGGVEAGLTAELAGILELLEGEVCRNLLRVFFLRSGEKKRLAKQLTAVPKAVKEVGVVGGGTMGAGIAHAMIGAGIGVVLVEVSEAGCAGAVGRVRKMVEGDAAEGRLEGAAVEERMGRLRATVDWGELAGVDLVVEAAFEEMKAKHAVFAKLEEVCRADAVLATNTSSLRVGEIGRVVKDPTRVVGLHFFNPVPRMGLVEVVRTEVSSGEALATAAAVAGKVGKVPVLVGDAPGFLVNRVLIPYLAEAVVMLREGVSVVGVDDAMKRWGMPMGPFELMDEIGLDVTGSLLKAKAWEGERVQEVFAEALLNKWLGKKSGRGFYVHGGGRGKLEVNGELVGKFGGGKVVEMGREDVQWRLALPMVNEAAGALREGVVEAADTIDLAMVMGAGMAPFRGGLTGFADSVGAGELVRRMRELEGRYGGRFEPDGLLVEWGRGGGVGGGGGSFGTFGGAGGEERNPKH